MGRSNTQLGRYLAPDYDDGTLKFIIIFELMSFKWFSIFKVSGRRVIKVCQIHVQFAQCWHLTMTACRKIRH